MNTDTQRAIAAVCQAIIETCQEIPEGVPGGPLYAALMSGAGMSFDTFNNVMDALVQAGKLRKEGQLYFANTVH